MCVGSEGVGSKGSGHGLKKALASLPLLFALCGCQEPPDQEHFVPQADAERGRQVIARVGCAACHSIPGVGWPNGRVGPALDRFAEQSLIAGREPNRADLLAEFVRNAPSVVPGTAMPPMPLTEEESRDVAAYLYTLRS